MVGSRTALQQADAERMLKLCDDLRDGRLRDAECPGRLRHAAMVCGQRENMQVAQSQPAPDLAVPLGYCASHH